MKFGKDLAVLIVIIVLETFLKETAGSVEFCNCRERVGSSCLGGIHPSSETCVVECCSINHTQRGCCRSLSCLFKLHAGTVEPSESVFIQSFGKILLGNILESSIDFLFLGLFDIHFPGLLISLEC